jgi:RNA polymerase sigma factor (sigma-70 family)
MNVPDGEPRTEDGELLRRYAEDRSEAAFAALVAWHLDFVYGCALRRVGHDTHLAEDVSQQVFRALADEASGLARRDGLSGWLFITTRNISAQLVRSERRRHAREQEASLMNEIVPAAEWEELRPVIDDALDGLSDDDRTAVLMRFYEGKPFAEVGRRLQLAENAARMRVERALEKMRVILARHGVTSTGAALGLALANHASVAAPRGLAGAVTGAALARRTGAGAERFMTISKVFLATAALVALVATGLSTQQIRAMRVTRAELKVVEMETREAQAKLGGLEGRIAAAELHAQNADGDARQLLRAIQDMSPTIALPAGDANCLAFVVDTSGSMRSPNNNKLWPAVFTAMKETLDANGDVTHVMAFDADGRIVFPGDTGWVALNPENLSRMERALAGYDLDTQSSPVPGLYRAMRVLPPVQRVVRLRVCVIGDEFNSRDQIDSVLTRLEELNPAGASGRRAASISAVQLPTTVRYSGVGGMGNTGVQFQTLMTEVTRRHGGTFKLLPESSLQ